MMEDRSQQGQPAIMTIDDAFAALQESRKSADAPTSDEPVIDADEGDAETANLDEEPVDGDVDGDDPDEEVTDESDDVEPDAEDEAEGAEDGDEAEDKEEAQSEDEAAKHRLRIGDEELEVTTAELKAGYLRDKDYRQKTQALADRRRELDGTAQEIEQDRQTYREKAEAYEKVIGQLSGIVDAEGKAFERIDWQKLKSDDLSEYLVKREEYREWQDKKRAATAEQQRLAREWDVEKQKEDARLVSELRQWLPTAYPHWADEAKLSADFAEMNAVGLEIGYSPDELRGVRDKRAIQLLYEAAQYRKMKSTKGGATTGAKPAKAAPETKPAGAVKVLKANAARPAPQTGQAAAIKKADARLRSGKPFATVEDAFEVFTSRNRRRA